METVKAKELWKRNTEGKFFKVNIDGEEHTLISAEPESWQGLCMLNLFDGVMLVKGNKDVEVK